MDLLDMKLFLLVAETKSISQSAEILHFSQSTISHRLKNLENELGVSLFTRSKGNRAELTPHGESFIPVAKRWQAVWEDTQTIRDLPSEALTVAAIESVNASILPPIYRTITGEMGGDLKLRIMTLDSPEIYDLVEHHVADFGFVGYEQQRRNVETIAVFHQRYCVVRYSDHPAPPSLVSAFSLDPELEIHLGWGDDYEHLHDSFWGKVTRYHVSIDTITLLDCFLTDEKYWAVLPEALLPELQKYTNTIQVDWLDVPPELYRKCYMIRHKVPKSSSGAAKNRFAELVKKSIEANERP